MAQTCSVATLNRNMKFTSTTSNTGEIKKSLNQYPKSDLSIKDMRPSVHSVSE